MAETKIEWTEMTWNPTTGCTKVTSGCLNCYAERMSRRLKAMGVPKYQNGFQLSIHPDVLMEPYKWKHPKKVFVDSMSDLFHEDVPLGFIKDIFRVMKENPLHIFQILTKRSEVLLKYSQELEWTENIWMGVTVENQENTRRISDLIKCGAHLKFLSIEPLIGPITSFDLTSIDWVIVGGESGPNARPINEGWVLSIRDQCIKSKIPFFFKQWGGKNKKKNGKLLEGRVWNEMPRMDSFDVLRNKK